MPRKAACLQLAERLFHSFAPLNEKHFLLLSLPFFGNLIYYVVSMMYFANFSEINCVNMEERVHLKLLKNIVLDSMSISS